MKFSPEPRRGAEEGFPREEGAGVMIMDNSEDDDLDGDDLELPEGYFEYELLPQEALENGSVMSNTAGPITGNSSDSIGSVPSHLNGTLTDGLVSDEENAQTTSECINRVRPEMEINADEVRAVMQNVTLPPSSFPPWATSISESQLTEYVLMRANRRANLQLPRDLPPL